MGAGGTFFHQAGFQGQHSEVVSLGCEIRGFDIRTTWFGSQDVIRIRPWGSARFLTDAHVAASVMRVWRFFPGWQARPVLGAGLNFQGSDAPRGCEAGGQAVAQLKFTCHGDPWVPLPVEFAFKAGIAAERWSVSVNHISNARLAHYNFGQNYLQLEFRW
jgi:hypothetical protein